MATATAVRHTTSFKDKASFRRVESSSVSGELLDPDQLQIEFELEERERLGELFGIDEDEYDLSGYSDDEVLGSTGQTPASLPAADDKDKNEQEDNATNLRLSQLFNTGGPKTGGNEDGINRKLSRGSVMFQDVTNRLKSKLLSIRLSRKMLSERLQYENTVAQGAMRLVNFVIIFAVLVQTLVVSDQVEVKNGLYQNLDEAFDFEHLSSVASLEQAKDDMKHIAKQSKHLMVLSGDYFEEDYDGTIELMLDIEKFNAPRQLITEHPRTDGASGFSYTVWIEFLHGFRGGYMVRKKSPAHEDNHDDLSCWGLYLDVHHGPALHFGGHDFYEWDMDHHLHGQNQHEVTLDAAGKELWQSWVHEEHFFMLTIKVNTKEVVFIYNTDILGRSPVPRKVTDCYNNNGIMIGDAKMVAAQMRFYPWMVSMAEVRELYYHGATLGEISTGAYAHSPDDSDVTLIKNAIEEGTGTVQHDIELTENKNTHMLLVAENELLYAMAASTDTFDTLQVEKKHACSPPLNHGMVNMSSMEPVLCEITGRYFYQVLPETAAYLDMPHTADEPRFMNPAEFPSFLGTGVTFAFWYRHVHNGYLLSAHKKGKTHNHPCWCVFIEEGGIFFQWDTDLIEPGEDSLVYPRHFLPEERYEWDPRFWRHMAWQLDDRTNTFRFFLDGVLAYEYVLPVDVALLDCDTPEKIVALGHRFPGNTLPSYAELADMRMFIGGEPLHEAQIYALAFALDHVPAAYNKTTKVYDDDDDSHSSSDDDGHSASDDDGHSSGGHSPAPSGGHHKRRLLSEGGDRAGLSVSRRREAMERRSLVAAVAWPNPTYEDSSQHGPPQTVSRECVLQADIRDANWVDNYGHNCGWYYLHRKESKAICQKPEAAHNCPIACQAVQECLPYHPDVESYVIWDSIQMIKTDGKNGTICLSDKFTAEEVVDECYRWKDAALSRSKGDLLHDAELAAYFQGLMENKSRRLDMLSCEQIRDAINPYCQFKQKQVDRFTNAMLNEHGGSYTMAFWVKSLGSRQSVDDDGRFIPQMIFYSSLSPPQHNILALSTYSPKGEVRFVSACDKDFENVDIPHMSQDGWTMVTVTRRNDGAKPCNAVLTDEEEFEEDTGEWAQCLFDGTFFSAIEVSQDMLISPIILVPRKMEIAGIQELYYQMVGDIQVRMGPERSHREAMQDKVDVEKTEFTPHMVMMAPPVIFQARGIPVDECPFEYSSEWLHLQHEKAVKERCHDPHECSHELLHEVHSVVHCMGGHEHHDYYGIKPTTIKDKSMYADFLYTITDHPFVVRDGEVMDTSHFVDTSTESFAIVLVFFSPEYGLTSVCTFEWDMSQPRNVAFETRVDHYEMLEGSLLTQFVMIQAFLIVFMTFLFFDNLRDFKKIVMCYRKACNGPANHMSPSSTAGILRQSDGWSTKNGFLEICTLVKEVRIPAMDMLINACLCLYLVVRIPEKVTSAAITERIVGRMADIDWANGTVPMDVKNKEFFDTEKELLDLIDRKASVDEFANAILYLLLVRMVIATSFHPRLNILVGTLAKSVDDLWHAGLLMVMIMCAFAAIATWRFGAEREEFLTFGDTMMTQAEMMLAGEFIDGWNEKADLALYTLVYMIVNFVLVLNFLLAIIVEAYMRVRDMNEENVLEMEFFTDISLAIVANVWGPLRYKWPMPMQMVEYLESVPGKLAFAFTDLEKSELFQNPGSIHGYLEHYSQMDELHFKLQPTDNNESLVDDMEKRVAWLLGRNPLTKAERVVCAGRKWQQDAVKNLAMMTPDGNTTPHTIHLQSAKIKLSEDPASNEQFQAVNSKVERLTKQVDHVLMSLRSLGAATRGQGNLPKQQPAGDNAEAADETIKPGKQHSGNGPRSTEPKARVRDGTGATPAKAEAAQRTAAAVAAEPILIQEDAVEQGSGQHEEAIVLEKEAERSVHPAAAAGGGLSKPAEAGAVRSVAGASGTHAVPAPSAVHAASPSLPLPPSFFSHGDPPAGPQATAPEAGSSDPPSSPSTPSEDDQVQVPATMPPPPGRADVSHHQRLLQGIDDPVQRDLLAKALARTQARIQTPRQAQLSGRGPGSASSARPGTAPMARVHHNPIAHMDQTPEVKMANGQQPSLNGDVEQGMRARGTPSKTPPHAIE